MRRLAIFSLVMLTAVLLQTTVFPRVKLFGVEPDLILVVVISLALLEGPTTGATAGFGGGLLKDLLLDAPTGITGFSHLLVGYAIGSIRPYVQSTSVFVPVSGIFLGSLVGTALYEVIDALLGRTSASFDRVLKVIVLTAFYNALLVPFVYPLIRRITGMYRNEKVYRW